MKSFTLSALQKALNTAPSLVAEIVNDVQTALTVADIGSAHNLHIDQIGDISNLTSAALLGLISPSEFLQELIGSGIIDAQAREILNQINQQIFMPLQEKIRAGGAAAQQPAKSAPAPIVATPKPPLPTQPKPVVPNYAPKVAAPTVPSSVTLPPKVVLPKPNTPTASPNAALKAALQQALPAGEPNNVVSTPKPIIPATPSPQNIVPNIPKPVSVPMAAAPRVAATVPAQPQSVRPSVPAPISAPRINTPVQQTAVPAPRTFAPPSNLPGAMPASTAPVFPKVTSSMPPTAKLISPTAPSVPAGPQLPPKPYSVDPYREPIDEK